jgi:isocitrate dehydrogenase
MSTTKGHAITHKQIAHLLVQLAEANIDFTHTEHLCTFDGQPGYTVAQDEQ